jgi:tripartite-type tricarboxylate transporter receptor subunit TctC
LTIPEPPRYPNKPIRVLIGYAPGGSMEASAQVLLPKLESLIGQPLLLEYRPGAAGALAMELIANARPDGYTVYYADSGPLTVAPHISEVRYDNVSSFTHLGHVCSSPSVLVVHHSAPFESVEDLLGACRREPFRWRYGTSGAGGPHHLSGEYFNSITGLSLPHVPYKGGGPAMDDLVREKVPMLFASLGSSVAAIRTGAVRALAVTSLKRSPALPNVPTLDELGLAGFESSAWYGLTAPAGLAPEIVERWSTALHEAGADAQLHAQLAAAGCEADFLSQAQTVDKIRTDFTKWGRVIRQPKLALN